MANSTKVKTRKGAAICNGVRWPKKARGCDVPVYGGTVVLVNTAKEYNDILIWAGLRELPCEYSGGVSCCIQLKHNKTGMWMDRPYHLVGVFDGTDVTLAHELIHVCFNIADVVGLTTKPGEANEAFAYLHTALMSELSKYVKQPKESR